LTIYAGGATMLKTEFKEIVQNGENSGVEFKRDDIRPEQLAKEIVALANLQGGHIFLGVEDNGEISGITKDNLELWVMDTVFARYIHPAIVPFYEEIQIDNNKKIAVLTVGEGIAKPYVLRHNDREDIYIRLGSTSRLATREQSARLFATGGLVHIEAMPVSGTSFSCLDKARLENYFKDILGDPDIPQTEEQWEERLMGMGFMGSSPDRRAVCSLAGLVLFGISPHRYLKQSGLRIMAFDSDDKQYAALLDIALDGPMVGRWAFNKDGSKTLVDEGLVEKCIQTLNPFISKEQNSLKQFRREKTWLYPIEAIRELVLNALAHRDWTRSVDIEICRYNNRFEVSSPGSLPNSMTVDKMIAGRRTPRNPIIMEVLRDYGYVDARGMGVRTKIIPLTRQFTGADPLFEATDDFLKTTITMVNAPENVPENQKMSLKSAPETENVPDPCPVNEFQGQLLTLIKVNPNITYNELSLKTERDRKTVGRHLKILKEKGLLDREGPANGGHWKVLNLPSFAL